MEKTTVYLTDAQKRALEQTARSTGRTEAALIREGVELVISRHASSDMRLPLFGSDQPHLAEHVDEPLRAAFEHTVDLPNEWRTTSWSGPLPDVVAAVRRSRRRH